jgi:hypothetical protein
MEESTCTKAQADVKIHVLVPLLLRASVSPW